MIYKSFMNIPRLSRGLIYSLNDRCVRYCHWKSNEHLNEALCGMTDIDILIDKRDKNVFLEIMVDLNIKKINSHKYQTYSGAEDWLGFCSETGVLLHLHVYFGLFTGKKHVKETVLPWSDYVLRSCVLDESSQMKTADPNVEIIILLIRVSIKAKYMTILKALIKEIQPYDQGIKSEFQYLKEKTNSKDIKEHLNVMFETDSCLAKVLCEAINKENIAIKDILIIKKLFNKELGINKRYSDIRIHYLYLRNTFVANLLKILEVMGLTVNRRKNIEPCGLFVAFIGSDGAGKSTIIDSTQRWLRWKTNTHKVYLGSGDGVNSIVLRFWQEVRKMHNNKQHIRSSSHKKKEGDGILSSYLKALIFIHMAKYKFKNMKKAYRLRMSGSIVLADRYPQIQFIGQNDAPNIRYHVLPYNSTRILSKASQKEESLYRKMIKVKPDIVIKLIVSPDVAIARKPDHDIKQIENKISIIKNLHFDDVKVYEVDANKSIEEVEMLVRRIIWENL